MSVFSKFNRKAYVAAVTAPVTAILLAVATDGFGITDPAFVGAITTGVTAVVTYLATWLVRNEPEAPPAPVPAPE